MSRKLHRAAMERMEATAARVPVEQPILTIPARTLAGTHYVPTLTLADFSRTAGRKLWHYGLPETTWTSYPAVRPA